MSLQGTKVPRLPAYHPHIKLFQILSMICGQCACTGQQLPCSDLLSLALV